MSSSVDIHELPQEWFERSQYRPKITAHIENYTQQLPLLQKSLQAAVLSNNDRKAARYRRIRKDSPVSEGHSEKLEAALESTYEDWNLARFPAAIRGIKKLGSGRSLCVVTGQQPGFLGGPLYVLYKALTAIALCREVERRGTHCVPVFWVAGEDHDIDEVRTARFPIDGKEQSFSLPHEVNRFPLSSRHIDSRSENVIGEFLSRLGDRKYSNFVEHLADQYRGRTIASGFAAMLAELLGDQGLVILDPEKLRPLARPILRRCIEHPSEVIDQIEYGSREIEASGLKPVVSSRFPLFLLQDGKRDHLAPSKNGLCIDGGGPELDQQELLDLLEKSPENFSAGALLRPIIQDYLLPSLTTIGGPAEVGYFSQLGPLSKWLDVEKPRILLRFQATILEGESSLAWSALEMDTQRFATAQGAENLIKLDDEPYELFELREIHSRLNSVGERLLEQTDFHFKNVIKGLGKAQGALGRLEDRIRKIYAQNYGLADWKNATTLWQQVLPGGTLQERHWGYLHLIADHGTGWIEELLESISADPFSLCHHLVHLKP